MSYTAAEMAKVYLKIRDRRRELKAEYEKEDARLREQLEGLEAVMGDLCKEQGLDSMRTPEGTIIRTIQTRYWPADWAAMHEFVIANNVPDLLERRVAQRAMAQWIEENPDNLPPGLQADRAYKITVRKPSN